MLFSFILFFITFVLLWNASIFMGLIKPWPRIWSKIITLKNIPLIFWLLKTVKRVIFDTSPTFGDPIYSTSIETKLLVTIVTDNATHIAGIVAEWLKKIPTILHAGGPECRPEPTLPTLRASTDWQECGKIFLAGYPRNGHSGRSIPRAKPSQERKNAREVKNCVKAVLRTAPRVVKG